MKHLRKKIYVPCFQSNNAHSVRCMVRHGCSTAKRRRLGAYACRLSVVSVYRKFFIKSIISIDSITHYTMLSWFVKHQLFAKFHSGMNSSIKSTHNVR